MSDLIGSEYSREPACTLKSTINQPSRGSVCLAEGDPNHGSFILVAISFDAFIRCSGCLDMEQS